MADRGKISITIDIQGKEAVNEFDKIYQRADNLKRQMNNLNDSSKNYRLEINKLKAELSLLTKGTQEYADKQAQIKTLNSAIKDNNENIKRLKVTIAETNQELEETRQKLGLQQMTYRQLQKEVSRLSKELGEIVPGTEAYINKAEELSQVAIRYKQVKQEITGLGSELQKTNPIIELLKKGFNDLKGIIIATFAIDTIRNFFQTAINQAGQFSDKYADIQKTTNSTSEEVRKLAENLQKLNTRTSDADLLGIAKIGGQIGVAKEELEGFTESVDKAVVALGDEFSGGAEEVAKTMGILKTLFAETKNLKAGDAINQIGSAVNDLGASGTATGPVITEFANRIGQLPGQIAPTLSETLGLGAALQEMGFTAEIASGGLTNVFLQAAKNSKPFAQQLGITEKEFKKAFNEDSNAIILRVAESLKGLSDTQVAETLKRLKLDSQESIKVLGALANNTDLVRNKQELASKSMKEATSLTNEFNIKNSTLQGEIDKAGKNTLRFAREIGEFLAPAFISILQLLNQFIGFLRSIPKIIEQNIYIVTLLTAAYFAHTIEVNKARIATIANTIADRANALGKTALTVITATYSSILGVLTGKITLATVATRIFNAALRLNPFGLIATAVGLVATGLVALYRNFEGFRSVVNGSFSALTSVFSSVYESLKSLFTFDFKGLYNSIVNIGSEASKAYQKAADAEAKARQEAEKKRQEARAKEADTALAEQQQAEREALNELVESEKEKSNLIESSNQEQTDKYKQHLENLNNLQKEYDQKALEFKQKREDLEIELIEDTYEREIAKIKIEEARKIEEVKKQIEELKKLEFQGVKIDPSSIENLKKQIDFIQIQAQKRLDEVELKQKISVIDTQQEEAKQDLISETQEAGTDEQKIEARIKFNNRILELQTERINLELQNLDRANQEELLKIEQLETQKAELLQKNQENNLDLELQKIEEKYQLLAEAEEAEFLEKTSSEEELRKQILEENFSSFLEAEMERDEALFNLKQESLQKQLDLLIENGQAQSAEARNIQAEMLKNQADFNAKTIENERRTAELKKKASEASYEVVKGFLDLGIELLSKDEDARKDNASAIKAFTKANIVVGLQREIQGIWENANKNPINALIPGFGNAFAVVQTAFAAARAGIAIAKVNNQEFGRGGILKAGRKVLKMSYDEAKNSWYYANGGYVKNAGILEGASHQQGGLSVFDNRTGRQVAEFEGGEPAMVLSKNTYKNNKGLIDSLLYTSLYQNGAPIRLENGGLVNASVGGANVSTNVADSQPSQDLAVLVQEIRELKQIVANQQTLLKAYVVYQEIQEADERISDIVSRNSFS